MCVCKTQKVFFKELNGFPYKMHVFRNAIVFHCYVNKAFHIQNFSVYPSGARVTFVLEICDFGSPTINVETNILFIIIQKGFPPDAIGLFTLGSFVFLSFFKAFGS